MAIMNNYAKAAFASTAIGPATFDEWTSTAATTFKVMFVSTLYSSGLFADSSRVDDGTTTDLASREIPGSSARINLTSRTVTVVEASDKVQYDAADITTSSTGGNVGSIIVVGPGTADNVRVPVCLWRASEWTTGGINLDGTTYTFTWSTDGLFKSS